jgi:hypothetical protein
LWYRKLVVALGRKFDFIAIGLLGGMYIKGDHNGVIDLALEKLERCNKTGSDDLYVKYYVGYALSSLQLAENDEKERFVRAFMEKYNVSENECRSVVVGK